MMMLIRGVDGVDGVDGLMLHDEDEGLSLSIHSINSSAILLLSHPPVRVYYRWSL